MIINKSDEIDDIMKCPHNYYLFKYIFCVGLSLYFSTTSAKAIAKIFSKTFRQIKYHRDGQNRKHIICNSLLRSMRLCTYLHTYFYV